MIIVSSAHSKMAHSVPRYPPPEKKKEEEEEISVEVQSISLPGRKVQGAASSARVCIYINLYHFWSRAAMRLSTLPQCGETRLSRGRN